MDIQETLTFIDSKDTNYLDIGRDLIRRLDDLGLRDSAVAFSSLHSSTCFVVYRDTCDPKSMSVGSSLWKRLFETAPDSYVVVSIDLGILDELKFFSPRVLVRGQFKAGRHSIAASDLEILLRECCLGAVRRHRAMIRRAFIEAKIGSSDLGTFCYRLLNEALPSLLPVEAASIFVLDKLTDELRLRGQIPPRTDGRHLSDIAISQYSESWVERTFKGDAPISEYDGAGDLRAGATAERVALRYVSRVYWPIRLQFRAKGATKLRMKDPVIGVIRLANISDVIGGWPRPFHCFDAFSIEFIAESLHNIVGAFVDSDVEGFNRDLAFHGAKTPAVGCLRNLRLAARLLFDPEQVAFLQARPDAVPAQFRISQIGRFEKEDLIRALNNAYAFAITISAQIDRANVTNEFHASPGRRIDSLFANVIQKSINLAQYFEISYSVGNKGAGSSRVVISRLFDLKLPPPVLGDEGALTSVFDNLLENSIKYSRREGEARIDLSWKDEIDHVCIMVRDNGIGIPDTDAERIFTTGVRSERARQHTVRGDGLGLAYCRRVLRAFGGSIRALPLDEGLEIQVRLKKAIK